MSFLELLLLFKIGVTALTVSAPALLFSVPRVEGLLSVRISPPFLLRLYGIAITALLFGYASGLGDLYDGRFPQGILIMGLVSNAGASGTLIITGVFKQNFWLMLGALTFGSITAGILVSLAAPGTVTTPLW